MKSNFPFVINRIIDKYEGGYSNTPGDPGGPTKYGITYHDLAEQLRVPDSVAYDRVKTMDRETALAIYSRKYEVGSRFDDLLSGPDMAVMDYDINSGLGRGPRVLAAILGLPQTGAMTAALLQRANAESPSPLIDAICDERLQFMRTIKGGRLWAEFHDGWSARVADVRVTSKLLVSNKAASATALPAPDPARMPKATHVDPAVKTNIARGTTGGAVVAGGSHAVHHDALYTALAVGGILAGGALAYFLTHRNQQAAQNAVALPFRGV